MAPEMEDVGCSRIQHCWRITVLKKTTLFAEENKRYI